MEKFRDIINNWFGKKLDEQIDIIDKICLELDIDSSEWFKSYISRTSHDFTGLDFFNEMLSSFLFYVSNKFDEPIKKFLPIKSYNIYKEPTYGILTELSYSRKKGFYFSNQEKKELKEILKKFTLAIKQELMQNKIFSYVIHQTNFKIYSKNEIRILKLKKLDDYYQKN